MSNNNNKIGRKLFSIPISVLIISILMIAAIFLLRLILLSLGDVSPSSGYVKIFTACELALVAAGLALLAVAALKSRKSNMLLTVTTFVTIAALLCYIPIEALLKNGLTAAVFIFCGVITSVAAAVFLIVNRAKTARMKILPAVAFASFVIEAAIGTTLRIGGSGGAVTIPVVSVLYLLFTMLCMEKYAEALGSKSLPAALLIGWLVLVPDHIYGFFLVDFPRVLTPYAATLCNLLGILAGFVWYRARARWLGWSVCCAMLALAVFVFVKGYALWLELLGWTS